MGFIKDFLTGKLKYRFYQKTWLYANRRLLGSCGRGSMIKAPFVIKGVNNIHLGDNCSIFSNATISCKFAKFIMKKNSGAAEGLTVYTSSHFFEVGKTFKEVNEKNMVEAGKKISDFHKDVVVDEDVLISSNVTLLMGVHIGRGAVIGSGSVVRSSIPPYAVVAGNPAKIIGYRYSPEEIIEHEKNLYSEEERLPEKKIQKNFDKYFLNREKISEFVGLY